MSAESAAITEAAVRDARSSARAAGLFYLATIGAGLYAQLFTRSALTVRGDAHATAQNILANEALFRSGQAADLAMLGCYIVVTALLYQLFRDTGERLSLTAALFSLVGIATLAATSMLHAAVPLLLDRAAGAEHAFVALRLHGSGYEISLVFFGVYCMLIGWLAIRSRALPVVVGALMMLGGAEHLVDIVGGMLFPNAVAAMPAAVRFLPLLGEASLALWLLLFGVRVVARPVSPAPVSSAFARPARAPARARGRV